MADFESGKHIMTTKRSNRDLWTTVLFSVLLLLSIAIVGLGVYQAANDQGFEVLALGVVAVVVAGSAAAITQKVGSPDSAADQTLDVLRQINRRIHLPELARRTADRERDRQALREAIIEDIEKQDYEAAMALVEEMAEAFGYLEEAEQYRQRIIDARARRRDQLIDEAVRKIDSICARFDWDAAHREMERLLRLYPEDTRIAALPRRLQHARDDHKRDLEREFLRASEVGNTEKAMELLKELDMYLTPQEAEAYLETARGVVGQARENMAVRFRMAVSDRDWIESLTIGEQILNDFPNSVMANEVRQMMDVLRERAAGQRAAEAGRPV